MSTRRDFLIQTGLIQTAMALPAFGAAENSPNILLLFPDQLRYDWTGANREIPVRTPNLDALGLRGTRFTRAIVGSPVCAPSRACLASGKEYDRCRVANNGVDYPLGQTTYYSLLRDRGYHVVGCGKLDLHKKSKTWGLDGKGSLPEWGFSDGIDNAGKRDAISGAIAPQDPYMAYLHDKGLAATHAEDFHKRKNYSATFPTPLPEDAYCDNWLSNNGLELMRRFPKGKPWHLAVNFTGPHEPMDITSRMDRLARAARFPQPNRSTEFTPEVHVAIRQNYSAMIENIDRWVGIYVDELRKRGELDNTIVVFSSDHGEMLGDHNRWQKSLPYQQSIGVPLTIAGPGVKKGVTTDALASIIDLSATFLDYAGIATPKDMDSRSLRGLLEGRTRSHREYVLSGLGPWRTVWDGRYKLITGFGEEPGGQERRNVDPKSRPPILYDHDHDPLENDNIAAREEKHVKRLSALLQNGKPVGRD